MIELFVHWHMFGLGFCECLGRASQVGIRLQGFRWVGVYVGASLKPVRSTKLAKAITRGSNPKTPSVGIRTFLKAVQHTEPRVLLGLQGFAEQNFGSCRDSLGFSASQTREFPTLRDPSKQPSKL